MHGREELLEEFREYLEFIQQRMIRIALQVHEIMVDQSVAVLLPNVENYNISVKLSVL
jgi:hypothetical protein